MKDFTCRLLNDAPVAVDVVGIGRRRGDRESNDVLAFDRCWNAVDLPAAVDVFQQLFGQFIFTLGKKEVEKATIVFPVPSSER